MPSALSNYQLGDLLGRGASGNVYRALNFVTGETVAIKSVSVSSLPASALPDIMSEIDLLKNLNHPNIVKYKGFTRDKESLFIVLEYCENGSLQSILKRFGKFPESLVAVYMRQVLEGLVYLHEQGVIHRDIKGANILTNKDGSVKLADFGVSSRAPTPDLAAVASSNDSDPDNEVVGSPYWMAPEVIEQSGATTASDVWSVGCVVVELLEGKPPYGDLAPMQALWRIVQDESMRIPDGASPIVKDFLYQCFQKDANLRVSAKKLLRHPWMQSIKRTGEGDKPGTVRKSRDTSLSVTSASLRQVADPQQAEKVEPTEFAAAVRRVQEWNEALNAAPRTANVPRASVPSKKQVEPKPDVTVAAPAQAVPAPSGAAGGLLLKNQHVTDALSRARESNEAEKWDDDFAFDSMPKLTTPRKSAPQDDEQTSEQDQDQDQQTLRPSKESLTKAAGSAAKPRLRGIVEDYSDLGDGEEDLELKLSSMRLHNKGRKRLMHIDDLQKIGQLQPAARQIKPSLPTVVTPISAPPTCSSPVPLSPDITLQRTPPGSRQNSLRGRNNASESNLELLKYSEADDEDYSDMFDGPIVGGPSLASLQLTSRSNRSWRDEDEENDVDPFAELEDDFGADSLEENLRRDKRATMQASVEQIIDQLVPSLPSDGLRRLAAELLSLLETAPPDMQLERHFVQNRGMLAILEVLESRLSRDLALMLLKIVNFIVTVDVDYLESFCLVGGIPVMIPYTSKKHHLETRLEASTFIQHLTRSALTLQMFISCRGLKVLVELLDEDYTMNKNLILSSLEGIGSVFDLQSPTPKPDFCRMFTREGILDPLSTALLAVIKDGDMDEDMPKRAVEVLLLFCQVAQGDAHVRTAFATRTIMMRILKALDLLPRKLLVTAIKGVKHLSTSPQLIEVLQNSNAMEILVALLGKTLKGSYSNEICSHIFQTVYSMCRLSKSRQEEASAAGIIPLLKKVIVNKSPLKQFALPVLCDLANAGKISRRLLWQHGGIPVYLGLLDDPYWRVSSLEAITAWMQDDPARVEDELLEPESIDSLSKCFVQSSSASYERILDPFLKIFRLSSSISVAIISSPFLKRLADTLERQTKAMITLNLLRVARLVLESHPDRTLLVPKFKFDVVIAKLGKQNDSVLVRELAKETLPVLVAGLETQSPAKRKASFMRKKEVGLGVPPRAARVVSTAGSSSRTSSRSSNGTVNPPNSTLISATAEAARKQQTKRVLSRSHLKDVQWETGEGIRSPLRPKQRGENGGSVTPRLRSGSGGFANGEGRKREPSL